MHCRKRNGVPLVMDEHRMDGGNVNSIGLKIQQVLRADLGKNLSDISKIILIILIFDLGNYTCELQNEYGVGASENAINLDVHCKCQA